MALLPDAELDDGIVKVHGTNAAEVGEIAFHAGVMLHELTTVTASLEAAFMTATGGAEEFVGVTA